MLPTGPGRCINDAISRRNHYHSFSRETYAIVSQTKRGKEITRSGIQQPPPVKNGGDLSEWGIRSSWLFLSAKNKPYGLRVEKYQGIVPNIDVKKVKVSVIFLDKRSRL